MRPGSFRFQNQKERVVKFQTEFLVHAIGSSGAPLLHEYLPTLAEARVRAKALLCAKSKIKEIVIYELAEAGSIELQTVKL